MLKLLNVRFHSVLWAEGKESSACAQGPGEAPSPSERPQCAKTSKTDAPVHASLGAGARPDAGPASQTVS